MDDAQMIDVSHGNVENEQPPFSEEEQEILNLYDQVQTLELEIALTKARVRLSEIHAKDTSKAPASASPEETQESSRARLLEAMALYNLRNTVVTSVVTANPILKGVHHSTTSSPVEQDLLPLVQTRDATAQAAARPAAALRGTLDALSEVESEALRACRRNRGLAAEVLRLAAEAERDRDAAAGEEGARAAIEALEARLGRRRQLWRVVKGTTAGIVVGSGVDWVGHEELREVVLDPE